MSVLINYVGGKDWGPINWLNPAICLFQARVHILIVGSVMLPARVGHIAVC